MKALIDKNLITQEFDVEELLELAIADESWEPDAEKRAQLAYGFYYFAAEMLL